MYASSVKRCVVMSNAGTMLEGPGAMECLVIFCLESSIYDGGASSARGANWRGSSASLAPPNAPSHRRGANFCSIGAPFVSQPGSTLQLPREPSEAHPKLSRYGVVPMEYII